MPIRSTSAHVGAGSERLYAQVMSPAEPGPATDADEQAAPLVQAPRHRSGSYAAADPRRELILATAIEHFAQWGYTSSSVPKIAADVGISRAGLLHHFSSKAELLRAVLEKRDRLAGEQFFGAGRDDHLTPWSLFAQLVAQARFNMTQPGLARLYALLSAEAGNREHPAHGYFQNRYAQLVGFLAGVLRDGVADGTLRPGLDCRAIAREILAVSDGLQIQFGLSDGSWDMADALRDSLDRLARSISVDGSGPSSG